MQSVSGALNTALAQAVLEPKTQIIMHLSNNRVRNPTISSDNIVNEEVLTDANYDPSMKFAFTDSVYKTDDWARVFPVENRDTQIPWLSSATSDSNGNFSPPVEIIITYPLPEVSCNKIVVTSDAFESLITSVTIDIKKSGAWNNAVTSYNPGDYKTEIYLQSSDGLAWSGTINRNFLTTIEAIRIKINQISLAGKALIYEVDAAVEVDISSDVISWQVNKERDLSGTSISPIGLSSANTASFSLENSANKYNGEHDNSPYKGMLYPNTQFDVYMGFKLADQSYEYIKQGEFLADTWNVSENTATVDIQCRDYSKLLQEKTAPQLFYNDVLIHEIIRDIAERAGILRLNIDTSRITRTDLTSGEVADIQNIEDIVCIPVRNTVWATEDSTYWDFIQQIAVSDLGVFYFDETGYFRFKIKESLSDESYPDMQVVKTLGQDDYLQNISYSTELLKNAISLEYTIPKLSNHNVGLWEADNPTILDATTLGGGIGATDKQIPAGDISDWYKQGYIKIDNEIIKYNSRSDTQFNECVRGYLRTAPASHSGGATIFEIRKFEMDYATSPATNVKYLLTNEAYIDILYFDFGTFKGEAFILNNYNGKTIVEGSLVQKALEGLPEFFILYGRAIEQENSQTINKDDKISIRKFGKQELVLNLPWVQSSGHAKSLLDYILSVYSSSVIFVDADIYALPQLQLGDTLNLNFSRLGLLGREFHIVGISIGMAGSSVTQSLRLRSKVGQFTLLDDQVRKTHNLDSLLKQTITQTAVARVDAYLFKHTKTFNIDSIIKKTLIKTYGLDSLLSKPTVWSRVDAFIPEKGIKTSRVDSSIKKTINPWSNIDALLS